MGRRISRAHGVLSVVTMLVFLLLLFCGMEFALISLGQVIRSHAIDDMINCSGVDKYDSLIVQTPHTLSRLAIGKRRLT